MHYFARKNLDYFVCDTCKGYEHGWSHYNKSQQPVGLAKPLSLSLSTMRKCCVGDSTVVVVQQHGVKDARNPRTCRLCNREGVQRPTLWCMPAKPKK